MNARQGHHLLGFLITGTYEEQDEEISDFGDNVLKYVNTAHEMICGGHGQMVTLKDCELVVSFFMQLLKGMGTLCTKFNAQHPLSSKK